MPFSWKDLWGLLKEAASEFSDDHASRLGAALAYYTVFSLAPLLVIALFVVGLIWGGQAESARASVVQQMQELAGPDGAELIRTMLDSTRPGAGGTVATVLSVVALVFGATGVFAQLQGALNVIWDVRRRPGGGLKGFATTRLLSFGMVIAVGFLLLVSLVISAMLSALDALLTGVTPVAHFFYQLLNLAVSLGVITLLFALIYRYLPDVEIAWRDVWVGSFVTAVLFTLGKFGIGLYLGNSGTASAYGAAGALVVLLLWVYYSAQILFFGAELTQVYARHYGERIRPSPHAVRVPDVEDLLKEKLETAPAPAPALPARRPAPAKPGWKRAMPLVLAFFVGRWLKRG